MNLRSGMHKEFHKLEARKKKKLTNKQTEVDNSMAAASQEEMHKLFADLKESLNQQFHGLNKELIDFRQNTERDIQKIMQQTADLKQKMNATITRVDQLETRVSDLDDAGANNQQTMGQMKSQIDELVELTDYLETKARQNNLCIYNVGEKSEGKDIVAFLTQLINKELGVDDELNIIRAHRTYQERVDYVRPIVITFLNNTTKMRVLQAAWAKKEVMFGGTRIYFDHDFSPKVRKQRALYKPIRTQLKNQGIKSYIVAPAKLKIFNADGSTSTFPTAETAIKALEEKGRYKPNEKTV